MKTPQQVIDYFRNQDWCLNESKIKLAVHAYNLGVSDALCTKDDGVKV